MVGSESWTNWLLQHASERTISSDKHLRFVSVPENKGTTIIYLKAIFLCTGIQINYEIGLNITALSPFNTDL